MYRIWPLFGFIFLSFFVDLGSQKSQAIQISVERSHDRCSVGATLEINSTFSNLPNDSDGFLQAQYTYVNSDSEKYPIVSTCNCQDASGCSVSEIFEDRMDFRCEKGSATWKMQLYINTTNEDINSSLWIYANYDEPDVKSNTSVELNVSNCENLYAKTDGLSITGGINASYTDTATYNCTTKDSWIMTGETIMNFTHYYQLVCMVDAKWNGTTDVSCAYPPTNASVTQSYFYENKSAQLICQHTPGHPKMNDEKFFIGKMNVTSNVTLLPEHYMKNYYCEIHNEYTDVSGKPARSDNGTLNVFFSPYDLYHTDDTQIAENETAEVYFAFRAHPNGSVVTNFTTPNGYILKELNYSDESPGSYNFTYSITVNSSDDYGKYIFIAKTIYPSGSVTGSINITKPVISTESTATNEIEGNEVDVPLIAGVCAGMFIVVLILVVLLILLRRRRERGISGDATGAKEEKDNPLYGTSVGAKTVVADKKGESLKEERENPLYASSAVSPVEEAYASVDTRKKKKNTSKGNDNNAFSTESAAVVYAAVNKPKKKKNDVPPVEAVYTEVNKKKR